MTHGDLEAVNTAARPQTVTPVNVESGKIEDGRLRAALKPFSYNVIRLSV